MHYENKTPSPLVPVRQPFDGGKGRAEWESGYTLIELVLTIIIVGIIAVVTASVLLRGIDTYSLVMNRKDANQHARVGMDRMVSELLLARWYDFTLINDTKIDFWDRDGSATSFKRTTYEGTVDLYRGNDFLAGQIALLDFDFYKQDNSTASWPWDVKRINIELTVQSLGGFGSVPLRTEVFPRNFMYSNFR